MSSVRHPSRTSELNADVRTTDGNALPVIIETYARDRSDDDRRDTGRLEPVRQIGESSDKEPWNWLRHGNVWRMRRQRSRTSVIPASRSASASRRSAPGLQPHPIVHGVGHGRRDCRLIQLFTLILSRQLRLGIAFQNRQASR